MADYVCYLSALNSNLICNQALNLIWIPQRSLNLGCLGHLQINTSIQCQVPSALSYILLTVKFMFVLLGLLGFLMTFLMDCLVY